MAVKIKKKSVKKAIKSSGIRVNLNSPVSLLIIAIFLIIIFFNQEKLLKFQPAKITENPVIMQKIFNAKVLKVSDGDTITISDEKKQNLKIRFYGIDAPESTQDYGKKSQENLEKMIIGKKVKVQIINNDNYGRFVAIISLLAENEKTEQDINLQQVKDGMAWVYLNYISSPYREKYLEAEYQAKIAKKGLWKEKNPTPPWQFRRN